VTEHDPTDAERREAEALKTALERGTASEGLPEDALEAAALLRFSGAEGDLAPDRRKVILDEILASAPSRVAAPERTAPVRWLRWFAPAAGVALAAAAAWALVVLVPADPSAHRAARLPAPSPDLLSAQAAAAGGSEAEAAALTEQMRQYRGVLYAALEQRYGAPR